MSEMRTRGKIDERHQAFLEERIGAVAAAAAAPSAALVSESVAGAAPAPAPARIAEAQSMIAMNPDTHVEWEPLGPRIVREGQAATRPRPNVSGRVNAIAVSEGQVYVAASNGGVWRSGDRGRTWESTMQARPHERAFDEDPEIFMADSLACGAVAAVGQRVYVGTGEGYGFHDSYLGVGAVFSQDGGDSWQREPAVEQSPALEGQGFYRIAAWRDWVFAATKIGLYERLEEGGWADDGPVIIEGSWRRLALNSGKPNEAATDVVVASKDGRTVFYAALYRDRVYRRDSAAGRGWSAVGGDLPGDPFGQLGGRVSLAVSDVDPDVVYALTDTGDASRPPCLYRLDTGQGGGVWKPVTGLPAADGDWHDQGYYNLAIALDPNGAGGGKERIYVGMARVRAKEDGSFVSEPEGEWCGALYRCDVTPGDSPSLTPTFIGTSLHPDIHALEFDENGALWVGCDGGVFRSGDGTPGENPFVACNDGLQTMTLEKFGQHPTKPKVLFCGCQDNGCLEYVESPGTWKTIQVNDAGAVLVREQGGATELLVSATQNKFQKRTGSGAGSWTEVNLGLTYIDPSTFQQGTETIQFYPPLVSCPGEPGLVATGAEKVRISEQFGGDWKALSKDLLQKDHSEWVRSLVFFDRNKLYAGTKTQKMGGGVLRYVRDPDTKTWTEQRLPALDNPAPVTGIAIDPADPAGDSIYVSLGGAHESMPRVCHYSESSKWQPRSGPPPQHLLFLEGLQPCERGDLDGGILPDRLRAELENHGFDSRAWARVVVKGSRWHVTVPSRNLVFDLRATPDGRRLDVRLETPRLLSVHHSAIVADPRHHGVLYAAADIGVWRSTDSGASWRPFSRGLPDAAVLDLQLFEGTPRLLRAATHGRGLFERSMPAVAAD